MDEEALGGELLGDAQVSASVLVEAVDHDHVGSVIYVLLVDSGVHQLDLRASRFDVGAVDDDIVVVFSGSEFEDVD